MKKYTFPTITILTATTIGIASVATPVRAAPGYTTGMPGSVCEAVQTNASKLSVAPNGLISNKSTTASAVINCPMPAELNRIATFQVSFGKKDTQQLTCVLQRRSLDYLSGSTDNRSTTLVGSGVLTVASVLANYFNSWTCTIPRNNGAGQNNVNGVTWLT